MFQSTKIRLLIHVLSKEISHSGYRSGVISSTAKSMKETNTYAYGLAQCWNSMKKANHYTLCIKCIIEAGQELQKQCQFTQGAIFYDAYCLLKYSDANFLNVIDTYNAFYEINTKIVGDPLFMYFMHGKVHELLAHICSKIVGQTLYARGKLQILKAISLYGATKCIEDLSSENCKKCLEIATRELLVCTYGMRGSCAFHGSCHIRFENYRFY